MTSTGALSRHRLEAGATPGRRSQHRRPQLSSRAPEPGNADGQVQIMGCFPAPGAATVPGTGPNAQGHGQRLAAGAVRTVQKTAHAGAAPGCPLKRQHLRVMGPVTRRCCLFNPQMRPTPAGTVFSIPPAVPCRNFQLAPVIPEPCAASEVAHRCMPRVRGLPKCAGPGNSPPAARHADDGG